MRRDDEGFLLSLRFLLLAFEEKEFLTKELRNGVIVVLAKLKVGVEKNVPKLT